jgi:hypothetical protein
MEEKDDEHSENRQPETCDATKERSTEDRKEPTGTCDAAKADQSKRTATPVKHQRQGLSMELSLALDSTPSSVFSDDMVKRGSEMSTMSTGSPATPVSDEDHTSLMLAISKHKTVNNDNPMARILQQAVRANRTHYHVWHKSQLQEKTEIAASVQQCLMLEEAYDQLRDSPIFLVHMARALPHTHPMLALLVDKEICRIGQALAGIGRMQMLHRFIQGDRMKSDAGISFCQEWILAIANAGLGAAQLADDQARWERLGNMCKFKLPPRRPPQLEPDDWYRLLVFAIALPEYLPVEFGEVATPQVCDAVMTYLTGPSRVDDVKLVAEGLRAQEWCAIKALFPADSPLYTLPQAATTRRSSVQGDSQASGPTGAQPAGPDRS